MFTDSYYMDGAFEISGNTVTFNVELYEYGYAGPQMMSLHDVPNDQGRQMRAVWDAGMPRIGITLLNSQFEEGKQFYD